MLIRAHATLGLRFGGALIAAVALPVLVLSVWAALQPEKQGLLLTILGIGSFAAAMALAPRVREEWGWGSWRQVAPAPVPTDP